jgi:hypothetical protein
MPMSAEVRTLDSGYDRETRSLLYHAYRHEPTFAYLFEPTVPATSSVCVPPCGNWLISIFATTASARPAAG